MSNKNKCELSPDISELFHDLNNGINAMLSGLRTIGRNTVGNKDIEKTIELSIERGYHTAKVVENLRSKISNKL